MSLLLNKKRLYSLSRFFWLLFTAFCTLPTLAQKPDTPRSPNSVTGLRYTAKGEVVVPMIFPVLGPCRWSDTWGAPRGGGTRQHQGQDLPAPKMRPLLACFDGVWTCLLYTSPSPRDS